ncbi:MAG: response regulator [Hahellaceae bacterium]|nr:response regulator [Hahellaceae bacterium]
MSNKICIVDDDTFYAEILSNLVTMQGFEARHFASAAECLSALASDPDPNPYQAFILDVVMPDMDGYSLCENLRSRPRFEKTPVLFVSSKNTLDDRMRGYEAGGNDYLGKPVQPNDLSIKLEQAIKYAAAKKTPAPQSPPPTSAVQASNVKPLVSFLKRSQSVSRIQDLGDLLLEQVSALGLSGSVMLRHGDQNLFMSVDGSEHAIEKELMQLAVENQRQIEFNQRLLVNYPHISLLIRRMPSESDAAENVKQQLDALVEVADTRITLMQRSQTELQQKKYWLDLLVAAEKGLNHSTADAFYKEQTISDIMEEFLISLNESLLDLALDKDQETALKQQFRKQIDKVSVSLKNYAHSIEEAQKPFQDLIEKLSRSL